MKKLDPQFKIRLPDDLKAALEREARAAGRSVTSEILVRLRNSIAAETPLGRAAQEFSEEWGAVEKALAQYGSDVRFAISARAYKRIKSLRKPTIVDEVRLREIVAKYGDPPMPLGIDPDVLMSHRQFVGVVERVGEEVREEGRRQMREARKKASGSKAAKAAAPKGRK